MAGRCQLFSHSSLYLAQLRDLVPPQQKESANTSQDNLDPTKRPKHVVLSDTILLVKSLADKVLYSSTPR